jgi:uncharacterized protein
MELAGDIGVAAPRQQVWDFLADTVQLSSCLVGLETAEIIGEGSGFTGVATISLGSQQLRFPTRVEWIRQQPPDGGRLSALARLGSLHVAGEGTIDLEDAGSGTLVRWQIAVALPDSLQENAMLNQAARGVAATVVRGFFACLQQRLNGISDG